MVSAFGRLVAGLVMSGTLVWIPAPAIARSQAPTITVIVCDSVGVTPATVRRAEEVASKVYRVAGIHIVWRATVAEAISSHASDTGPHVRLRLLYLRLVPASQAPANLGAPEIMGFARPGALFATVVYPRVVELSRTERVDTATLLGYAMAHELGHLLLRSSAHSSMGVMRGVLDTRRCGQELLWFNKREGAAMRATLAESGLIEARAAKD